MKILTVYGGEAGGMGGALVVHQALNIIGENFAWIGHTPLMVTAITLEDPSEEKEDEASDC